MWLLMVLIKIATQWKCYMMIGKYLNLLLALGVFIYAININSMDFGSVLQITIKNLM